MKKLSILLLFIATTITLNAQLPQEFGRFKRAAKLDSPSPDTELISKIGKVGAFVLTQSYQLEDSVGKFFGLSGKKEFGCENTLAVKVKDGYILYDIARVPWDYNPQFVKLKKRYTPVFFPSQYSELRTRARYDSIYFNDKELVTLYPNQLYGMKTDTFFNDGFPVAHHIGKTEGYAVWYILPTDMDLTNQTNLEIVVQPETIDISEDRSKEYQQLSIPQVEGQILGGIFIIPEISRIGRLDFALNGIMIGAQDEWKLICPFSPDDSNVFNSPAAVSINLGDDIDLELTPNVINER